ncbi:tetratricopeptide repeat protein [Sulfurimonas marina]|uniref:Flagellar protein n=1 Tax=Sulfurimonas marina TaxID=2590551 RepID=A0A7M1AZI2_9BACT|nr:flagellar protein [Sulfurimonas marina]QOP41958.1 flagellar protein [Sulfurimonas marina]
MFKWILLTLIPIFSFALEISIDSAKDNFIKYSTLHLNDQSKFTCKALQNEFEETKEIVCAFSKRSSKDVKHLEDEFFKVNTFIQNGTFFLSIKPKHKMKLYANIFDLTEESTLFTAEVSLSNSWIVIGYKEKFPLVKKDQRSDLAINFPFYMEQDKLPYVGSLDIKGNPVSIKRVEDVSEYIKVKEYFEQKDYERCLDITNDILKKYPNTLFKAELLYYKIKIYAKLKDYDNVIANAKIFLREYSADENVAEVLSLIAHGYSKIGLSSDSDYFFDRLFSEHAGNKYAQYGFIYKGEALEESGGASQAEKFYKRALYETKDVDVAVDAAYHLSNLVFQESPKESSKYLDKILKVKPEFFKEDLKASLELVKELFEAGEYQSAADIDSALFDAINPTYDEYEEVLAHKGLYLAHTTEKRAALDALNSYMKKFPDGDYLREVELAKDQLFFDVDDMNSSVKLAEFNKLIEEYQNDSIGSKALYEKAKLLNTLGKYAQVLNLKSKLLALDQTTYTEVPSVIETAAIGAMQESLEKKNCEEVLIISSEHNVTLSSKWDDSVYECAMIGGDYQLAKKMTVKNIDTKDAKEKEKWLFRYIKVDFATGNYLDVLQAAKDLTALIELDNDKKYLEVYRILFDTYNRLEKQDQMIDAIVKVEEVFKDSYKDIDRYANMVAVGVAKKDDNMVIKYGKKIYDLQKRTSSHAQTPYIEFSLYQAYMNKDNYENALEVIKSLDDVKLSTSDRARQKYLLGSVYSKLWKDSEAQKAYDEAIAADKNSAWAKLAQSAKNI